MLSLVCSVGVIVLLDGHRASLNNTNNMVVIGLVLTTQTILFVLLRLARWPLILEIDGHMAAADGIFDFD